MKHSFGGWTCLAESLLPEGRRPKGCGSNGCTRLKKTASRWFHDGVFLVFDGVDRQLAVLMILRTGCV
jgi:hypothetical protein